MFGASIVARVYSDLVNAHAEQAKTLEKRREELEKMKAAFHRHPAFTKDELIKRVAAKKLANPFGVKDE